MTYKLNGRKITRAEFVRLFSGGMIAFIEQRIQDAIDDGNPIPWFNTDLGPLVINVK